MNRRWLIVFGLGLIAIFYVSFLFLVKTNTIPSTSSNPGPTLPLAQTNLTHFKNDVIGLEFDYPEVWGSVRFSPVDIITNLGSVNKLYVDNPNENDFKHMIKIYFSQKDNTEIQLIDNSYRGELYPNGGAINYGPMNNFQTLVSSHDICQYKINFNQGIYHATELYPTCSQGLKEVVVKEWQNDSDFQNYYLRRLGYHRLQNGYFDNLLVVSQSITAQSHDTTKDLTLSEIKSKTDPAKDQMNYQELVALLKSIKTSIPPQSTVPTFQSIPNENPNLTLIRHYYYFLTNHQFDQAFALTSGVTLENITTWYQNIISAEPRDFKMLPNSQYEFFVDYQDENSHPVKFLVRMAVSDNKIKTLKSEKLITDTVTYGKMSAVVKESAGQNYLVFTKNGESFTIDKAPSQAAGEISNLLFSNLMFSQTGRYLVYGATGWEWYTANIVDTQTNKTIKLSLPSARTIEFNKDDSKLFTCAKNEMSGEAYATVYDLKTLKIVKDFLKDSTFDQTQGFNIDCRFDQTSQKATVKLTPWETTKPSQTFEWTIN